MRILSGLPAGSQNSSSFEDWARGHGLPVGSSAEDPDGDGVSNLIEYATGTDPLDLASFPRVGINLQAGVLSLTCPHNSSAVDLIYRLQVTTNLSASILWQSHAERRYPIPWFLDGSVTSCIATNNQLKFTIKTGGSNEAQKYFRVQVERPGRGASVPWTTYELVKPFPQLEILSFIGQGGMGTVYRARQKALDRVVALKILPPGIGKDPAFAERFTREAKALARLNHPSIVTLYEFGQTDGLFFFLMEFVDGMNLRHLLEAGRLSPGEALAIVLQ